MDERGVGAGSSSAAEAREPRAAKGSVEGGGTPSSAGGDGTEMVHVEPPGSHELEAQKAMLYPGLGQAPADFIRTVAATEQGDGVDLAGGTQQEWVMLTPPPTVQQDSMTCWAAALEFVASRAWERAGYLPADHRSVHRHVVHRYGQRTSARDRSGGLRGMGRDLHALCRREGSFRIGHSTTPADARPSALRPGRTLHRARARGVWERVRSARAAGPRLRQRDGSARRSVPEPQDHGPGLPDRGRAGRSGDAARSVPQEAGGRASAMITLATASTAPFMTQIAASSRASTAATIDAPTAPCREAPTWPSFHPRTLRPVPRF